ncbi:SDR family NAD(P)-dependent oxidoreductase [Chloroflexota bacterium]
MEFCLAGKKALITGGSRGIGRVTALCFARAGADVAIAARKQEELEEVAEQIKELGRKSIAVVAHVGKLPQIRNLIEQVKAEFGHIDILVNNAGTNPTGASAIDIEEPAWDVIMNLNLKGAFFLSQAVAKIMREHGGGVIINVSSSTGIRPGRLPVYSISKAGLIMATMVLAKEWGQYGIRVNAVAPGTIETRFSEAMTKDPEVSKELMAKIPLRRFGVPEDIAGLMLYLASDASAYVTGTVVSIDGGMIL